MTDLLVVLTGLVLLVTVVAVLVLGRDRLSGPGGDGIRVERAPEAPLVLPERPTAQDLERIAFHVRRRGYDRREVRDVLALVARRLPPEGRSSTAVPEE